VGPAVCLTCYADASLVSNRIFYNPGSSTCEATCALGMFASGSSCVACSSPCRYCSSATTCTACLVGSANPILHQSTCINACPSTYYPFTDPTPTTTCSPCVNNCHTCTSQPACTSCQSSFFLTPSSTCSANCPLGRYPDSTSGRCELCAAGCVACTGAGVCSVCAGGFAMVGGVCSSSCPLGTVMFNGVCQACEPAYNCLTCEGTIYSCTSCNATSAYRYLARASQTCVSSCQDTRYFASNTDN
jgi:hypothetical protein